jgi:hypothetical protein
VTFRLPGPAAIASIIRRLKNRSFITALSPDLNDAGLKSVYKCGPSLRRNWAQAARETSLRPYWPVPATM